jgi:DNA-binding Lrp family transcriptional regulator
MKWTEEKLQQVIEMRNNKMSYVDIAKELDCTLDSVKHIGSKLIKDGRLRRAKAIRKYSREELLEVVKEYKSQDSCPMEYRHYIRVEFGSWTQALSAAGMRSRVGGVMDSTKPTTLYLLDFGEFYKVGITQRDLKHRFRGAPKYEIIDLYCSDLNYVAALEQEILSKVKRVQPEDPWFSRQGKTECFSSDVKIESLCDLL